MKNYRLRILLTVLIEIIRICLIMPFITFVFFYSLDNILINVDLGIIKANYFYYLLFSLIVYGMFFRKEHKKED